MSSVCRRAGERVWLVPLLLVAVGQSPAAMAELADHLVLSEAVVDVHSSEAGTVAKYVEIVNPTETVIALANVHLTNAMLFPTNKYWEIVLGTRLGGGGAGAKFHCRFPAGATLAPGDTLVIAVKGSAAYLTAYGRLPDFELYEDGLVPDSVAEMVEVFPGSIGYGLGSGATNQPPDLTGIGGSLILYLWDGQGDLVTDLDYLHWGRNTNVRFDKTNVTIDGSDPDDTPSTYLADTAINAQTPIATASNYYGKSFQRASADEGTEPTSGGNGLTGHNESGEPLPTTWAVMDGRDPPSAPALPFPPAPIFMSTTLTPATPTDGLTVTVTARLESFDTVASATLSYSVDGGAFSEVGASDNGDGTWSGEIPGQNEGAEVTWYFTATTQPGTISVTPAGAPLYTRGYTVAAAPEPGQGPVHLLVTEVCVQPNEAEFIEIHNPTDGLVELGDYHLSDAIFRESSQYYWRIVQPNPNSDTAGGGTFNDFHARFPEDAILGPGQTITIAIAGSDAFATVYGQDPDYELYETGDAGDGVPELVEVFPGSITGELPDRPPGLSNASETVVLYYWDGTTDLVTDVDVYIWGNDDRFRFSKTGVVIDGPDGDNQPTAYQPETGVFDQLPFLDAQENGMSYQRTEREEGDEVASGSNGVGGHDEVSEEWERTWRRDLPTPGVPSFVTAGEGAVSLRVPPRTFLPLLGETFPIGFSTKKGNETRLRIFDLEGRLVITLFDSRFDGFASTDPDNPTVRKWEGRDSTFELVRAGMYVVHLFVVDEQTGKEEIMTAPVVVATRLSK